MSLNKWTVKQYNKSLVDTLMQKYNISSVMATLLCSRSLTDEDAIQKFFSNSNELSNPFLIKDMDKAVSRVHKAIDNCEKICVYGDYDADGVTATVIVYNYLFSLGADVFYYIPNRESEGYGLNCEAIEKIASQGANLILTVDNGISATKEVEFATSLGVDVVVTDHHKPQEILPKAVAVVDPHRKDDTCPFKDYAGVGVALMLLIALEDGMSDMILQQFSDIAAIGTVADVVSLKGDNRIIVKHGLQALYNTENVGLRALIEKCSLSDKKLTAESLAFVLAPKINAAGRMGDVNDAVELLITEDEAQADALAEKIISLNSLRREFEEVILKDISDILEKNPQKLNERVLVLWGKGWHQGIIGIVCARLMEKYSKPCILMSVEDSVAKASARSIKGFSIIDAITHCSDSLLRFGGHEQAAGFSLKEENIESFSKEIQNYAKENFFVMPPLSITVDKIVTPKELSVESVKELEMLEPFGCENEKPIFAIVGAKVKSAVALSQGKHTRLVLEKEGVNFDVIWFSKQTNKVQFKSDDLVDVLFNAEINEFGGVSKVSLKLKDIRPSGIKQDVFFSSKSVYDDFMCEKTVSDKTLFPTREEIGIVYKFLRQNNGYNYSSVELYCALMKELSYLKIMISLEIMSQLKLITLKINEENMNVKINLQSGKLNLNESEIFRRIQN